MKFRFLLTFGLLTGFIIASCAPVVVPEPVQTDVPLQPEEPVVQPEKPGQSELSVPVVTEFPVIITTELPVTEPQEVFVSRGDHLVASDPASFSLTSGDLQFVEFIRFT
ncbi:MAG: hypothetical protein QGM50_06900 [Anaerolineae bacterium]|nr:hypothetical protein [Anaerolineae bacterium]